MSYHRFGVARAIRLRQRLRRDRSRGDRAMPHRIASACLGDGQGEKIEGGGIFARYPRRLLGRPESGNLLPHSERPMTPLIETKRRRRSGEGRFRQSGGSSRGPSARWNQSAIPGLRLAACPGLCRPDLFRPWLEGLVGVGEEVVGVVWINEVCHRKQLESTAGVRWCDGEIGD